MSTGPNELPGSAEITHSSFSATLLVVDDSPAIHSLVQAALSEDDYRILHALDGESALAIVEKEHPELIILDVDMPGLNGFEVCSRVKSMPNAFNTGVIFLASAAEKEDRVRGLELGSADFIGKPFDTRELSLRVRNAWRSVRLASLLESANHELAQHDRAVGRIPRLGISQVIEARSKNPWQRRAPISQVQTGS